MQIGTPHHLELPTGLRSKLEAYRRRVWIVKLAEGILAGMFGLLLSYLLVFTLDRFWDTPVGFRWLLLLAGATGFALWFPFKWHRWVWQTRQLDQAARLLRHRFPRVGDQLLGIVELAHNEMEQERSESLCRAAMRQVDEEVRDCDFRGAVPDPRHRRWAWATGGVLLLAAAVLGIVPAAGTNALARWLYPWKNTERYTFAQLNQLPDRMVVPLAEPFVVDARLSPRSAWSPEQGRARYGRQEPVLADRDVDQYQFALPPQKEPDDLTISVGDTKKKISIAPTSRPELTEIVARIELPDYLQYSSFPQQDVRSGSLSVVRGSRVSVAAFATRQLTEAHLENVALPTRGNRIDVPARRVVDSGRLQLQWRDDLGLSSKTPFQLRVTALDDEPPTISGSKLQRERVVLSTDAISFEVLAQDDFGVREIGMQWQGIEDPVRNPQPAVGQQVVAAGGPERSELRVTAVFSTERLRIQPQSLKVRLFAVDYLPDREPVYTPTYIFHVLSPEEHAIWLTNQLRKWFRQANEVYEREQQLYQANKALRALSPDELDRPETRRRVEEQASAEQSNARRLSTLTRSGDELMIQATHNDQFNVATLENWAQMLQALHDIAEKRMPSVADLLTEAANAPGAKAAAQPQDRATAGKTPPQVGIRRDSRSGPPDKSQPAESAPVPVISDVESGFNELQESKKTPAGSGQPSLGLPTTDVVGGGPTEDEKAGSCPAEEKLAEAVTQQEDLLAEFARIAEELKKILGDLEGSTFVKRLKAASRRQLDVAGILNETLAADFGLSAYRMDEAQRELLAGIAQRELAHGDEVYVIQDDLEAYYNRVREGKFRTVLNEMKAAQVVSNLHGIAKGVQENLNGQSLAEAEFWADALDRWAEQLVGPG